MDVRVPVCPPLVSGRSRGMRSRLGTGGTGPKVDVGRHRRGAAFPPETGMLEAERGSPLSDWSAHEMRVGIDLMAATCVHGHTERVRPSRSSGPDVKASWKGNGQRAIWPAWPDRCRTSRGPELEQRWDLVEAASAAPDILRYVRQRNPEDFLVADGNRHSDVTQRFSPP